MLDLVFSALADPTRRALLDALFAVDGQTLGALVARTPGMTRFGVAKHLGVLEAAELVSTRRDGREKHHFLNPVPIQEVADRWIGKYARPFTRALLDLRDSLEPGPVPMALPRHQYRVFIKAPIDRVFQALVDPAYTRRYFHGTAFDAPPVAGQPFRTSLPDGSAAVDGVVEVLDAPHRFVHTWHVRYSPELEAEPASRVEWTLTEAAPGLTRVDLVHSSLDASPKTSENVREGWIWIVDALKTVLETGEDLPAPVR